MIVASPKPILLVDDDEWLRAVTARFLRATGFHVVEAANGRAALDRMSALASPPAMIVSDWEMPIMGGRELIEALRASSRFASIPIVVVTGSGADAVPEDVPIILKPFAGQTLVKMIKEHASRASQ